MTHFFGNKNTSIIPPIYQLHFEKTNVSIPGRAKRYLLRLINTSFDSTFIFSIDNHWLQIIGADFVPIEPYYNTSVLIGIGQRYHVIVEADPVAGVKTRCLTTAISGFEPGSQKVVGQKVVQLATSRPAFCGMTTLTHLIQPRSHGPTFLSGVRMRHIPP